MAEEAVDSEVEEEEENTPTDHTLNKDQEEVEVKLEPIKMLLTHMLLPQRHQLKNENILPS